VILPPGTILQFMYFKERLKGKKPGNFIEVGVGQGNLSKLLLEAGWKGTGYELNPESIQKALQVNRAAVARGQYEVKKSDWLKSRHKQKADLIVSSMVIEHLNPRDERRYFQKARGILKAGGTMALFVPACPDYWGEEDEIAGHYRRYTFQDLKTKAKESGLRLSNLSGLNYPISNWLYPLSEFLVSRAEGKNKKLKMAQRTRLSGNRDVPFKTHYPWFIGLVLNEMVLYPFHLLQKINAGNSRSMVIYAELEKPA
jgi:SAM-dependent methyltransferase